MRPFLPLLSVLCAAATAESSAAAAAVGVPASEIGTAVKAAVASPVFGGGLATPVATLLPTLFEPGWKSRGAAGGMEPDAEGWRPFEMKTSSRPEAPRIAGRARFSAGADGSVRGEWLAVPAADAPLEELFVGGTFSLADFAGGTALADGRTIPLPVDCQAMRVFHGTVSELTLRDRVGAERLRVVFEAPTSVLLQDNRAWGGTSFSLRLFLAEGAVKGGREYALRASFSTPADGLLALDDGKSVRIEAGADWVPLAGEPWIEPGSALDFSRVLPHHAPAGKFGRVVAVGDHFEFEARPGEPVRFYGVNLCGDANAPSTREAAGRFAANLARMGYNAVRFHHHERALLGGSYREGMDDTAPDPAAMDRFDALVAACVEHGIYVTTDLFVSRSWFTTWRSLGIDRDGCLPGTDAYKMLCAFWEPAYTNLCEWSRAFLGHVNPYTGRSLADEPALCALALVNEGNLGNWGGGPLRDTPGVQEAWRAWLAAKRAGGAGAESAAFADIPDTVPDNLSVDDGATPAGRHAAAFAIFLAERETLLANRLRAFLRDELHCEAPLSSLSCWYNPVQYQLPRTGFDYVDDHFYVDHPSFLGQSWKLPSRCPNVNPMQGSGGGARSVVFRRLMDKPFCITEWNYAGPGRYRGVGGIATGALGALQDWSGLWRFAWSHGKAGVETPEKKTMGYFDVSGDPLSLAAERAALCLFLRRDLEPLAASYPVTLARNALLDPRNGAPKCQANGWLWAAWHAKLGTRVVDGDGSHAESAVGGGGGSGEAEPPPVESHAESAEGAERTPSPYEALVRPSERVRADLAALGATAPGGGAVSIDPDTGTFLLDTPRTAGGFAERGAHTAGPLTFTIESAASRPLNGASRRKGPSARKEESSAKPFPASAGGDFIGEAVPATVWVSSLDGEPIARSSHLLLTHLTDVQNSGTKYADEALTILLEWGSLPHLMRRGAARIELALDANDGVACGDKDGRRCAANEGVACGDNDGRRYAANEEGGSAANEGAPRQTKNADHSVIAGVAGPVITAAGGPVIAAEGRPVIASEAGPIIGGKPAWRVFRLSPSGRRLGEVPFTWETLTNFSGAAAFPAAEGGDFTREAGILRFVADTALDPAAATFLYEIVRVPRALP